uniref:Uncharacterized protein n=1 Tax=viral metagenome TaxID=1070528 RepID=A0A6M3IKN9_9ZZZZ
MSETIFDAGRYTEQHLYASGAKSMSDTITAGAITLNGDGTVTVTVNAHGFAVDSMVYYQGTTAYNGLHKLTAVAANTQTFAVTNEIAETMGGTETCDIIVKPEVPFTLHEVRLNVGVAATTAENFTMQLDSGYGAAWDCILDTVPMAGETDIHRMPTRPMRFQAGDALLFDWTNTDAKTWSIEIVYGTRSYGHAGSDVKTVG